MSCTPSSLRATEELQHSSPQATLRAAEQPTSYVPAAHKLCASSLSYFRAAAQQLRIRSSSPRTDSSRASARRSQTATKHFQTAREPPADPQSASDATRAHFASTLEPLRLRTLRPPALKIDRPSKYRILPHVSKQGL